MNVNSFQDRENVIPGQEYTKHCRALPNIAKSFHALPSIAKCFQSSIIKIIENQANNSTLVHPQSTLSEIMDLEFHSRSKM